MAAPPYLWLAVLVVVALAVGIWWARTQQLSAQRRSMRAFYTLSEQIFAAPSPTEIAEKLADRLTEDAPSGLDHVYLVSGGSEAIELLAGEDGHVELLITDGSSFFHEEKRQRRTPDTAPLTRL